MARMNRRGVIQNGGPRHGPPYPPKARKRPGKPGALLDRSTSLALLLRRRRGLGPGPAEVVLVGHAPANVGVEVPLHRALGERLLRLGDLLEQRVVRRLLVGDLVIDLELLLEHVVRCLVDPDLVLGLQLDVVLRVAVDRLPRYVL